MKHFPHLVKKYEKSVDGAAETSGGGMNTPTSRRVELMNSSVLVDRT